MKQELAQVFPKIWGDLTAAGERLPLELANKYARISEKLETLWGSREAMHYLDSLLLSERSQRQGFSEEVIRDLLLLKQVHELRHPEQSRDPYDPFAAASFHVVTGSDKTRGSVAEPERQPVRPDAPVNLVRQVRPGVGTRAERAPAWGEIRQLEELHAIMDERKAGIVSPPHDGRRIGQILLERGLITQEALDSALAIQKRHGERKAPLGQILVKTGAVGAENLIQALCLQAGVLRVDLMSFPISAEAMALVPVHVARGKQVVPVAAVDHTLFLAVADPFTFTDREFFAFLTNRSIELMATSRAQLIHRLNAYGQVRTVREADEEFRKLAKRAFIGVPENGNGTAEREGKHALISQDDATVIGLVNKMISDAAAINASDIHIEAFPGDPTTRIRFRHDGSMENYSEFPSAYHEAVVSRIKIMADLDISEKRRPQDGKISFPRPGLPRLDLRVATIPTMRGIETVTIRLLAGGEPLPLDRIGMHPGDLARFREVMQKPYGLILVCGPTGSGKTTTLHSVLRELNTPERKIWTAEDPVEIVQRNICQVQVNPKIDWNFANALRAFLRADPDVVMIGEMRDQETARIAIEASMTGHLVLSTLHTNSSAETAARLLDLGADPYNLSDAILAILAQRLARRLCGGCAKPRELKGPELEELASEHFYSSHGKNPSFAEREAIVAAWRKQYGRSGKLFLSKAAGCSECNGQGYRGRLALFELLVVNPDIRSLVRKQASAADFLRAGIASGMHTLKQDGIEKALMGLTDMYQVRGACI